MENLREEGWSDDNIKLVLRTSGWTENIAIFDTLENPYVRAHMETEREFDGFLNNTNENDPDSQNNEDSQDNDEVQANNTNNATSANGKSKKKKIKFVII